MRPRARQLALTVRDGLGEMIVLHLGSDEFLSFPVQPQLLVAEDRVEETRQAQPLELADVPLFLAKDVAELGQAPTLLVELAAKAVDGPR